MYRQIKKMNTSLAINRSKEGESLETKLGRLRTGGGEETEMVGLIYQEGHEGVQAAYDIRADRMAIAMEMNSKGAASQRAKRDEKRAAKVIQMQKDDTNGQSTNRTEG